MARGLMRSEQLGDELKMDRTTPNNHRQGGCVESARRDLPYAQIPLILLRLPTGERAAAIEVWATLHQHLRLGTSGQKVSDETLSRSPYLQGRSRRFLVNGLNTLERLGLVGRQAKGSSRRLAIMARLAGPKPTIRKLRTVQHASAVLPPAPADEPVELTPEFMAFLKAYSPAKHQEACAHQNARKA